MKNVVLSLVIAATQVAFCGDTELLYSSDSPDIGPFPSDVYTVPASDQRTGRRINLSPPQGCNPAQSSACADAELLKQMDGFSLEPRIRLCFSDTVNASTIDDGVFVVGLHRILEPISVERVFVDPATKCVMMRPAKVLEPEKKYALIITDRVKDAQGNPVKRSSPFKDFFAKGATSEVSDFVNSILGRLIVRLDGLAGLTLFTTTSATDWIRQSRDFVNAPTTPSIVEPIGPAEGFPLAAVKELTWLAQTSATGPMMPTPLPTTLPGVGRLALGVYYSPNFIATEGPAAGTIPYKPSKQKIQPQKTPVIKPQHPGYVPVAFNLWLPASPKPRAGYPVVIYGHGLTDSRFGAPTAIAPTLAQQGFATIAMEVFGHGFGPGSLIRMTLANGQTVELPAPGRGVQLPTSTQIGPVDGCIIPGAYAARDCTRQTAVDIFALIRAIKSTGGYYGELDPNRIFYVGQSFGSTYGALVVPFEPSIRASVMNVPPASTVDTVRLAQERTLGLFYLATRVPSLLNYPFEPSHPMNFDFNDNFVYRGKPPLVNSVPGAPAIQDAFEVAEWFNMSASPLAFAPLLQGEKVLYQFAKGDQEVPNPTNSAFIRAANGRTSSRYLRFDTARAIAGAQLPAQPHRFLANPEIFSTDAQASIAIAAQKQVAGFFAANGNTIPNANTFLTAPFIGQPLFETPETLPDDLNFVRVPATPPTGN